MIMQRELASYDRDKTAQKQIENRISLQRQHLIRRLDAGEQIQPGKLTAAIVETNAGVRLSAASVTRLLCEHARMSAARVAELLARHPVSTNRSLRVYAADAEPAPVETFAED